MIGFTAPEVSSSDLSGHSGHMGGSVLFSQREFAESQVKIEELEAEITEQKNKFQDMFDENDKLRVAMQEILESIRYTSHEVMGSSSSQSYNITFCLCISFKSMQ